MGFCDGSGVSWTVRKQSAPRSRQITKPTLSVWSEVQIVFYRPDALRDAQPTVSKHWRQDMRLCGTPKAGLHSHTNNVQDCSKTRHRIVDVILHPRTIATKHDSLCTTIQQRHSLCQLYRHESIVMAHYVQSIKTVINFLCFVRRDIHTYEHT